LKFRTFITYCLLGYECSKLHSTLAIIIRQNKTSKFWSWKLSGFNRFLKSAPIWNMSTWAFVPRSVWSSFQVVTLASTSNNYTLLLEVTQQQRSNTPVHSPGQETTDHITIPHPVPNRFLHLISSCISFKIGRIEESGIDSRPGDSHETFCLLRFFRRPLVRSSSISIIARDPSPDLDSFLVVSHSISVGLKQVKLIWDRAIHTKRSVSSDSCSDFLLDPARLASSQQKIRVPTRFFVLRSGRISLNLGRIEAS